jgi:hypothetical protein
VPLFLLCIKKVGRIIHDLRMRKMLLLNIVGASARKMERL